MEIGQPSTLTRLENSVIKIQNLQQQMIAMQEFLKGVPSHESLRIMDEEDEIQSLN